MNLGLYKKYLIISIILCVFIVAGYFIITKYFIPDKYIGVGPIAEILKIELTLSGGGVGCWQRGDLVVMDIQNSKISITKYDQDCGSDKPKSTTTVVDYSFSKIYPKIVDLIKQNKLKRGEIYKGSKQGECIVYDAGPGYATLYFKNNMQTTVSQDFCQENKLPYSFFGGINRIYRDIDRELKDCRKQDGPIYKDVCYFEKAMATGDAKYCTKIVQKNNEVGTGVGTEFIYNKFHSQAECFIRFAITYEDIAYCDKIAVKDGYASKTDCYFSIMELNGNPKLCEKIKRFNNQITDERCDYALAIAKSDESYCDKITDDVLKQACFVKTSVKKRDYSVCNKIPQMENRAKCIFDMALITKNKRACNKMPDICCYYYKSCGAGGKSCEELCYCSREECKRRIEDDNWGDVSWSISGWNEYKRSFIHFEMGFIKQLMLNEIVYHNNISHYKLYEEYLSR